MGRDFLETSYLIKLLRAIYEKYYRSEQRLNNVYRSSAAHRAIKSSSSKAAIAFRYSFLGRITEVGDSEGNPEILSNSKVVKWGLNFCNKWKSRLLFYSNASNIAYSTLEAKSELYSLPVKTGGMIVFTAVLTNTFLSLLMRKEIGAWWWSMRGVLLFAAFWGIFCKVGWEELKKTSHLMRHVEKRRLLRPPRADSR
jgi:hypothetical protein